MGGGKDLGMRQKDLGMRQKDLGMRLLYNTSTGICTPDMLSLHEISILVILLL